MRLTNALQHNALRAWLTAERWAKKMADEADNKSVAIGTGYPNAKKALRLSVMGLSACILHIPAGLAAAMTDTEFLVRIFQIAIVGLSAPACWFAAVSIVKMEEKTWLACIVELFALVELVYGAKMLTYEFHRMTL